MTREDVQPALAGVVAALVGFAGSFTVVLAGLRAVGADRSQASSGLLVLSVGMGVTAIVLCWRTRMLLSIAWSTPGAALLIGAGPVHGGYAAALGAFVVSGGLTVLAGLSRRFERGIAAIPAPLASALLAGVLLPVCLSPARAAVALHWPHRPRDHHLAGAVARRAPTRGPGRAPGRRGGAGHRRASGRRCLHRSASVAHRHRPATGPARDPQRRASAVRATHCQRVGAWARAQLAGDQLRVLRAQPARLGAAISAEQLDHKDGGKVLEQQVLAPGPRSGTPGWRNAGNRRSRQVTSCERDAGKPPAASLGAGGEGSSTRPIPGHGSDQERRTPHRGTTPDAASSAR